MGRIDLRPSRWWWLLVVVLLVPAVPALVLGGWGKAGILAGAAALVLLVAVIRGSGTQDDDDDDGAVWDAIPSWQNTGRHVESGGIARAEQERALQEIEERASETGDEFPERR